MQIQRYAGKTVENMPYGYDCFFEDGEDTAFAIQGFYYAKDSLNFNHDKFLPTYFCHDTKNKKRADILPWVIDCTDETVVESIENAPDSLRPTEFYDSKVLGYFD